jgi:hypothetical protein
MLVTQYRQSFQTFFTLFKIKGSTLYLSKLTELNPVKGFGYIFQFFSGQQ